MSNRINSPFLSVSECADYLKLAVTTVYKKVHYDQIPYRKHGSRVVFVQSELDHWSLKTTEAVKQKTSKHEISKFQSVKRRLESQHLLKE